VNSLNVDIDITKAQNIDCLSTIAFITSFLYFCRFHARCSYMATRPDRLRNEVSAETSARSQRGSNSIDNAINTDHLNPPQPPSRLGPGEPHLDFLRAMELEHAFALEFETSNYGVRTTPRREWAVIARGERAGADMRHGRRVPDVEALLVGEDARRAGLGRSEVIAVVLYTGPMVAAPALAPSHRARHNAPGAAGGEFSRSAPPAPPNPPRLFPYSNSVVAVGFARDPIGSGRSPPATGHRRRWLAPAAPGDSRPPSAGCKSGVNQVYRARISANASGRRCSMPAAGRGAHGPV
jgi:hypothetical protein